MQRCEPRANIQFIPTTNNKKDTGRASLKISLKIIVKVFYCSRIDHKSLLFFNRKVGNKIHKINFIRLQQKNN